jgi:hypothetical protein
MERINIKLSSNGLFAHFGAAVQIHSALMDIHHPSAHWYNAGEIHTQS